MIQTMTEALFRKVLARMRELGTVPRIVPTKNGEGKVVAYHLHTDTEYVFVVLK